MPYFVVNSRPCSSHNSPAAALSAVRSLRRSRTASTAMSARGIVASDSSVLVICRCSSLRPTRCRTKGSLSPDAGRVSSSATFGTESHGCPANDGSPALASGGTDERRPPTVDKIKVREIKSPAYVADALGREAGEPVVVREAISPRRSHRPARGVMAVRVYCLGDAHRSEGHRTRRRIRASG